MIILSHLLLKTLKSLLILSTGLINNLYYHNFLCFSNLLFHLFNQNHPFMLKIFLKTHLNINLQILSKSIPFNYIYLKSICNPINLN
jgi:hypothetical protein